MRSAPAGPEDFRKIAAAAEETYRQMKALNRRLAAARTRSERDEIKALMAAAEPP
jgi:hypothetical protein